MTDSRAGRHEAVASKRGFPLLMPIGDCGLLIRFDDSLNLAANKRAVAFAHAIDQRELPGVTEIAPSLVSVFLRYEPWAIAFDDLAAAVRLELFSTAAFAIPEPVQQEIAVTFGGGKGPDLEGVAELCGMSVPQFVAAHNRHPLRVLATGFSPGFVYCGMHDAALTIPRRAKVRPNVAAGSVLFAAGQTAIMATPGPTGWHVIGKTGFNNFDVERTSPTILAAGDLIRFEEAGD